MEDNRVAKDDCDMKKPKDKGEVEDKDECDMMLVEETPSHQQGNQNVMSSSS